MSCARPWRRNAWTMNSDPPEAERDVRLSRRPDCGCRTWSCFIQVSDFIWSRIGDEAITQPVATAASLSVLEPDHLMCGVRRNSFYLFEAAG